MFTEARSPHILDLKDGKFDVIVRAYDVADNYQESVQRLRIMSPLMFIATSTLTLISKVILTM